ncbi:ParA family protein [Ktedonospora formicarum]|nr:AAA family ATPase [Ktedonospora formicarum]
MSEQKQTEAIVLSAVNEKGGVTKTTSTANLAVMLSRLGFRVLAIDGDPQGHLTFTFGYERNTLERTLYEVLLGKVELRDTVLPTFIDPTTLAFFDPGSNTTRGELVRGPDLVPINMRASAADGELRGKLTWPVLLRRSLAPLVKEYDYILIDTNPSLGVLTVNALCASQSIFIPLVPEVLSVQGLGDLLQVVHQVKDDSLNPQLTIAGVAFTKVQKYKGHQEIISTLRGDLSHELGITCFNTALRQSAVFTNAANRRSVVVISDPYSEHAKDYWRLLEELLQSVGGPALEPVERVVQAIHSDANVPQ